MNNPNKLWYTRKNETISGPFTLSLIRSNFLAGRLSEEDMISEDQLQWQTIVEFPELANQSKPETIHHQRDERDGFDRRSQQAKTTHSQRKAQRRAPEPEDTIQRRQLRTMILQKQRQQHKVKILPLIVVLLLIVVTGIFAVKQSSQMEVMIQNCQAPPIPGVNWENCLLSNSELAQSNLQRANLRNTQLAGSNLMGSNLDQAQLAYANLSYANLSYASLKEVSLLGANLQGADLTNANLAGSNLTHADLRGAKLGDANLENTRLDNAIWTDGFICAPSSFGECIPLIRQSR
ncbi:MAG: pentapeptide repeat-containing protein [Methylophaga sp.]|nr:pentapeptide repeat-containing protein [Methylophaga sp.]